MTAKIIQFPQKKCSKIKDSDASVQILKSLIKEYNETLHVLEKQAKVIEKELECQTNGYAGIKLNSLRKERIHIVEKLNNLVKPEEKL